MIETGRLVLAIFATVFTGLWIILVFKNEDEFREIVDSVDKDEYPCRWVLNIGLNVMRLLHIDTSDFKIKKRIKEIAEIRGETYAQFYYIILTSAKWSYGISIAAIFSILGAISGSAGATALGFILAIMLAWYQDEKFNDKLEDRRTELLTDFPQMITKMLLLINSGMTVREAWKKIADDTGNRELGREMKLTVQEIQNGVTEINAYNNFADRCSLKEIKKFSNILSQSLQKGNSEISKFLKDLADEMWENKKNTIKKKAEAANTKLIIPTAMIFIGVMLMIMIPAFSGM